MTIKAYAAKEAGGLLEPFEYDPGDLLVDEVEIDVDFCGICHSDLSMLNNEWQMTEYPLVPGLMPNNPNELNDLKHPSEKTDSNDYRTTNNIPQATDKYHEI